MSRRSAMSRPEIEDLAAQVIEKQRELNLAVIALRKQKRSFHFVMRDSGIGQLVVDGHQVTLDRSAQTVRLGKPERETDAVDD